MEGSFSQESFSDEILQILESMKKLIFPVKVKKTTNIYKQNPVLKGCYIINELEDVLKNGFHESSLIYDNVEWFVNKVSKLKKNWLSFLKILRKISL